MICGRRYALFVDRYALIVDRYALIVDRYALFADRYALFVVTLPMKFWREGGVREHVSNSSKNSSR